MIPMISQRIIPEEGIIIPHMRKSRDITQKRLHQGVVPKLLTITP